ncbi:MAG: response regulator transcription factor [Armatimonadota bacterium]|jgi:DNA-binding NarL/FixJ family response regulator|nr:response regulator transcription factor [Armatimonadota bacterium]
MRLLIVDDHELVREALRARLELMPGIQVVGEADSGLRALELVPQLEPDLVILDFRMPQMNGAECARQIKRIRPACRILFLTGFPEEEALLDAVDLAAGYVTKSASWSMLTQAIEAVLEGKAFVDPNLVPAIMSRAAGVDQQQHLLRRLDPDRLLTPMEGRVALLAARQRSNEAIASELGISENTVKAHLQHAFRKLGAHSRRELAARLEQRAL